MRMSEEDLEIDCKEHEQFADKVFEVVKPTGFESDEGYGELMSMYLDHKLESYERGFEEGQKYALSELFLNWWKPIKKVLF